MSIYTAAITLFLVMDPLGNIPVFLGVLRPVPPARRKRVILREMVIALAILVAFLFSGKFILRAMHISEPALSMGGGIVLFLISIRMIFPASGGSDNGEGNGDEEPLIVPMAIPLVAGPSAMATLILFATQYPQEMLNWLVALIVAWTAALVVLTSAEFLRKLLGKRGIAATERLMGMILTTMAVQMFLSGVEVFVTENLGRAVGLL